MYAAKRKLITDQNQGSNVVAEQQLWHGTGSDAVPSIIMYGYNRSYCGKNGKYKDGVLIYRNYCEVFSSYDYLH